MPRAILVTGATGKQGGAVVESLLRANAGFSILAVTRNPNSPAAQRLSAQSPDISLVQGDLDHPGTLFENAKKIASGPIWGVYSVQNPMAKDQTVDKEVQQGKALIDQSLKNGVGHFVYSSVDRGGSESFNNPTPVPHFASKHKVEHYLVERTSTEKMSWTILRPAGFMDNYTNASGFQAKIFFTAWKIEIDRDRRQQVVAVSDIGYFAAQAFVCPEKYKARAISLAGDELTFDEMARVFAQKTGQTVPTTFGIVASLILRSAKDINAMFKWMNSEGFKANIEELKQEHPGLVDFGTYIEKQSGFVTK
ncbi:hypothetical protein DL768_007479 [Monosporascus sp. mg162]|nr:hypothetical protein DL768_007479 [Monosporascus sp. mg162]